ncbi:MAG TPA: hypothetical protein VG944_04865 [Fimbriimonas sp.]|nr:hypothetical protein [Fimbriimonas sp.]
MSPDDQIIDTTSSANNGQIYPTFKGTPINLPDPTTQGHAAGMNVTETVRADHPLPAPEDPPEAIPRINLLI